MSPNGHFEILDQQRRLSWLYGYSIEMENYCLTIVTPAFNLIDRIILTPNNYMGGRESRYIPISIEFKNNESYLWRIDTSAEHVEGVEFAGSESIFASFLYVGG